MNVPPSLMPVRRRREASTFHLEPDRRNKLFYFGSWERNSERQGFFSTYTVPTAKMRAGDFSEVLALNPTFRIYDPATGTSDGANRAVLRERDDSRPIASATSR